MWGYFLCGVYFTSAHFVGGYSGVGKTGREGMFVNGCGFGDWGSQILETDFVIVSWPGRREDQWSEMPELCRKN